MPQTSSLIASLIFLLAVVLLINYLRHRNDYKGKLFVSQALARESRNWVYAGTVKKPLAAYEPVQSLERDYGRGVLTVVFQNGYKTTLNRNWLLTLDQLPNHLR